MSFWRRRSGIAAIVVITASLVTRLATWFTRDFNHDDFYLAYLAWIRSTGARPGVDFRVPNFTPVAELLAPLFGAFPESFTPLVLGRVLTLAVMFALLALPYAIARRSGATREWALVAVALITCHADFVKRAADLRADGFSSALLLGCLFILLGNEETRERSRDGIAAILFGLAVALSYKFLLALPFVAAALLLKSPRRLARVVTFVAIAALPGALYLGWRVAADGLPVVKKVIAMILSSQAFPGGAKYFWLERSLAQNAVAYLAIAAGVVALLVTRRASAASGAVTLLSLGFVATYLAVNPFIFPYAALVVVPLLAPAAAGIAHLLPRDSRGEAAALILLPLAFALSSMPANVDTVIRTNDAQRRVVEWLWRTTPRNAHAFDWVGMHFGRRGVFEWHQPDLYQAQYEAGRWSSMSEQWRRGQVAVIIETYRLLQLNRADTAFLAKHYVKIDRCLNVPGTVLTRAGTMSFEAVAPGRYRVVPPIQGLTVDGRIVQAEAMLTAGMHAVTVPASASRAAIVHWPAASDRVPLPCPADEPLLYGFE